MAEENNVFDIQNEASKALIKDLAMSLIQEYYENKPEAGEQLVVTAKLAGFQMPEDGTPEKKLFTKYMGEIHNEVQKQVQDAINAPMNADFDPDAKAGNVKVPFKINIDTATDAKAPKLIATRGGLLTKEQVAAATVALFLLTQVSCKKGTLLNPNIKEVHNTIYNYIQPVTKKTVGQVSFHYDLPSTITGDNLTAAQKFNYVIMNPSQISPDQAKAMGINVAGYASGFSIVTGSGNTPHIYDALKDIQLAYITWQDNHPGQTPVVGDPQPGDDEYPAWQAAHPGQTPVVGDPQPAYAVDLANDGMQKGPLPFPEHKYANYNYFGAPKTNLIYNLNNRKVFKIVKDDMIQQASSYPGGLAFDEFDQCIAMADPAFPFPAGTQLVPASFTTRITDLYAAVARADGVVNGGPKGSPKMVRAFSGLQPSLVKYADQMLPIMAQQNCGLILESRVYGGSGNLMDSTIQEANIEQILKFAQGAKNAGRHHIVIDALEPRTQTAGVAGYEDAAEQTAKFYQKVIDRIKAVLGKDFEVEINMQILDVNSQGYFQGQNPNDFKTNQDLKKSPKLAPYNVVMNFKTPYLHDEKGNLFLDKEGKPIGDYAAFVHNDQQVERALQPIYDANGVAAAHKLTKETDSFSAKLEKGDGSFAKAIAADLQKGHAAQIKAQKAEAEANKDKGIA